MPKKSKLGKKGAKGGKKGKKGKGKKGKKIKAKYAFMEFDYELIAGKERDEIETICVNIRSDLQELRGERIYYQLQRDYFNDLIALYLQKIRDARDIPRLLRAQRNAMVDETEYLKGGFLDKMLSNIDFSMSVVMGASEVRMLKRHKKIKKRLEMEWQEICAEFDELERLAALLIERREEKMTEMEDQLDDMQSYIDEARQKNKEFMDTLKKAVSKLYADLELMDYLDIDYAELYYNKLVYEFLNMMSWRYFMFKNIALDNVHNILTAIMMMIEHWDQMDEDCKFMTQNIALYKMDTEGLAAQSDAIRPNYNLVKINHQTLERLRRALKTTFKLMRASEDDLLHTQETYKNTLDEVAPIEEELNHYKAKLPYIAKDLWATYQERYKIAEFKKKVSDNRSRYAQQRLLHDSFFPTIEDADLNFYAARAQVQMVDGVLEHQKFRSLRILKHHDDSARSIRAGVRRIGHQGWRMKFPHQPAMLGMEKGMRDAPAGLVARRTFTMWGTVDSEDCQKCPPRDPECYFEDD